MPQADPRRIEDSVAILITLACQLFGSRPQVENQVWYRLVQQCTEARGDQRCRVPAPDAVFCLDSPAQSGSEAEEKENTEAEEMFWTAVTSHVACGLNLKLAGNLHCIEA